MIIRDINISNKFINYSNLKLDFSSTGIYFLQGENGTGKTTIMEDIIFNNNDIQFQNPTFDDIYKNNRFALFSYIPQNIIESDDCVKKYLYKGNRNIELETVDKLIEEFDIKDISMTQRFSDLSGGEKTKLAIISALAKKTPFVFLDEPTNYLDNSSVNTLIDILNKYSQEVTFIIASHDKRLLGINSIHIVLNGCSAVLINEEGYSNNSIKKIYNKNIKPNKFKIVSNNINTLINNLTWLLILLTACGMTAFFQYSYYENYSIDAMPSSNMILAYSFDRVYDDLNNTYANQQKIKIKPDNKYKMVYPNDIPTISSLKGSKKIYIKDFAKYIEFTSDYNNNQIEELHIFSLPDIIYKNPTFLNHIGMTEFSYLEDGRLPLENKLEVSISKELLVKNFNYDKDSVQGALGESIIINNKSYTIVGIQHIDVCLISYSKEDQYGLYEYSEDTYERFVRDRNEYLTANNFADSNIDCFAVVTEKGHEEKILNYMLEEFPAHNYYSYKFVNSWVEKNNGDFEKAFYIVFSVISIILGICFYLIQRNQIKLNIVRIKDYANYYMMRKKLKYLFLYASIGEFILLIFLNIAFLAVCNITFGMFDECLLLVLHTNMLLILPSVIYIFVKVLFAWDKN